MPAKYGFDGGDQRQAEDRNQPARTLAREVDGGERRAQLQGADPRRAGGAHPDPSTMPLLAMATDGSSASTRADKNEVRRKADPSTEALQHADPVTRL